MTPDVALLRATVKYSDGNSSAKSPLTSTRMVPDIAPTGIVSVPFVAMKSTPTVAEFVCALNSTLTGTALDADSVTRKSALTVPASPSETCRSAMDRLGLWVVKLLTVGAQPPAHA